MDAISAEDQTTTPPPAAKRAGWCGAIVLTRHGEPNLSRKVKLSAAGYEDWWARYEEVGLLPGQTPPAGLAAYAKGAAVILSSTRPRAIETARAVADGREFDMLPILVEAPLPPPRWPDWFKLSPRLWGVTSRIFWWYFDAHGDQEGRAEAEARADAAADKIDELARQGDVLVVAHGFFNTMVGRSLRRHGWRLKNSQGYKYWAMRRFERGSGPVTPAGPELAAATLES